MKVLYLINQQEDYLADSVMYGLRMKLGADLVDFPKKEVMYQNSSMNKADIYGFGFTLWKLLPDIEIDRDHVFDEVMNDAYDVIIFSDIYRQQNLFAHWTVFDIFKNSKAKFSFLDGSDDGFPTVCDAFHRGIYFKRDNPFNYPQIKKIGLSIPESKLLTEKPQKHRLFSTYVQCEEAYEVPFINDNCTNKRVFDTEEAYYKDLSVSKYGVTMKKSGWDTPRHMENASQWVVNCIYQLDSKPIDVEPYWTDGENCIGWNTAEELTQKINRIEGTPGEYERLQRGSVNWMKTKTCEAVAEYVLGEISV